MWGCFRENCAAVGCCASSFTQAVRESRACVYHASYQLASKQERSDFLPGPGPNGMETTALGADGRLVTARLTKDGLEKETCIRDFADMRFEELQAPY